MAYITQERLRELFDYSDGFLIRKVNAGSRGKVGDIVKGINHHTGYLFVKVDGEKHLFHRAIWIWHHGDITNGLQIDHKNGNKADNRLENLRLVTQSENQQNRGLHKKNTSGFIGVTWHKRNKKWQARIKFNYKSIHLGVFDNKEDAAKAYLKAKKELHTAQPVPRFL